MRNVRLIFIREFAAYFATPLAYVFIVIFLMLAGLLTFFMGGFLERDQADLVPFFRISSLVILVSGSRIVHAVVGGGTQIRYNRTLFNIANFNDSSSNRQVSSRLGIQCYFTFTHISILDNC